MRTPAQPVLVLMGVSGSGKSTVAALLAAELGWAFQEGDALHPRANVEKMAAGVALDDHDRAPWLAAVRAWIEHQTATGEPGIVTCSALRRRYRDVLRGPNVVFVELEVPAALLAERLAHRRGHFMGATLLGSQLDTLEPPEADEQAVTVDASHGPVASVDTIIGALGLPRVDRLQPEGGGADNPGK